ncbi:MAG: hypothetical protein OXS47_11620 [Chloroflexota bacterium]|nr:hypothetical protein [Chloroflexota bacterium]
MLADAGQDVVDLEVRGLDCVPEPVHPPPDLGQLFLDSLQLQALFVSHAVHLLIHHAHKVANVRLREDVLPQLLDDQALEALRVEARGLTRALPALQEGVADVVGVLASLGLVRRERLPAGLALDQTAEEIGTGGAARVDLRRGLRAQQGGHALELLFRDDGGKGPLDAHGRSAVPGLSAPDQGSCVDLVAEDAVDAGLQPELAPRRGDALVVEGPGDVQKTHARGSHAKHPANDFVRRRVELQLGALLGAILHGHLLVAEGGEGGDPEATRGRLAHPPRDFLGQILRVKFVHALDDRLHELAGGRVVGVLGDGHHADAAPAEHRLEGDGVLALAREARELPDEDLAEGRVRTLGGVQHPAELGPVGDAPALGLVDVLAHDAVVVLLGVVAQRAQLGGDGKVDVLAVAGDARVEGGGGGFGSVCHRVILLICLLTLA